MLNGFDLGASHTIHTTIHITQAHSKHISFVHTGGHCHRCPFSIFIHHIIKCCCAFFCISPLNPIRSHSEASIFASLFSYLHLIQLLLFRFLFLFRLLWISMHGFSVYFYEFSGIELHWLIRSIVLSTAHSFPGSILALRLVVFYLLLFEFRERVCVNASNFNYWARKQNRKLSAEHIGVLMRRKSNFFFSAANNN